MARDNDKKHIFHTLADKINWNHTNTYQIN